jgi:hypothetical protein
MVHQTKIAQQRYVYASEKNYTISLINYTIIPYFGLYTAIIIKQHKTNNNKTLIIR